MASVTQSLPQRVTVVARQVRLLVWLHGVSRFVAAAVAAIVTLGVGDYFLRFGHPVGRWALSAAALGLICWVFIRLVLPVFGYRGSRIGVSRRIEERFPQLGERLSCAIAFAGQSGDDATAGSVALRRAVVAEVEVLARNLDFGDAIEWRGPRRAALLAGLALAIAGLLAAVNPAAASLAVSRLVMPWRDQRWPRRHELVVVNAPTRAARGDDVEIAVIDRRVGLPDAVQLLTWCETDNRLRVEEVEMKRDGDRMVAKLEKVTGRLFYRARGGDDDTMRWIELKVVEPPRVVELSVVVEPPDYTGLPAETVSRVVSGLVGSKLRVSGKLDRPIRSARARAEWADDSEIPQHDHRFAELPGAALPEVQVAADGKSFVAPAGESPWLLERSGAVWFELADEQGLSFEADTRIELRVVADAPPTIAWESLADRTVVTARAVVRIRGVVKDDVGVRAIEMRYLRVGRSDEETVIPLYRQSEDGTDRGTDEQTATYGHGFEYEWDLSLMEGLSAGDELAVRVTAEDLKSQSVASDVRRLSTVTEEEFIGRMAARQREILSQLNEALATARQSKEQTTGIDRRLREADQITTEDVLQIQAAHHTQRQVERLLGESTEGALGQIRGMLDQLTANRASNPSLGERLGEVLTKIRELHRSEGLPEVDHQLTAAYKAAREALEIPASQAGAPSPGQGRVRPVTEHLSSAKTAQANVIGRLEEMVGTLSDWDSFSRLAGEVRQIRSGQEQLAQASEELRLKAVTAAALKADDREAALLQSRTQLELARELEKLQMQMEETLKRTRADDPLAAALGEATGAAGRLAIGGQMREAAAHLGRLQFGQAVQAERAAIDGLTRVLESLSPESTVPDDRPGQSETGDPNIEGANAGTELIRIITRQQEINRRTAELDQARTGGGSLTAGELREVSGLASEQGRLAEAVSSLLQAQGAK